MRSPVLSLLLVLTCGGCSQLAGVVNYTNELTSADSGRTIVVRGPAQFGGLLGFIAGIPFDIAALPVTYGAYKFHESQAKDKEPELATHLMFPSILLWKTGKLLGAPFDVLEWGVYRSWLPPKSMTEEERRDLELRLDEESLPRYPVQPIYPLPEK